MKRLASEGTGKEELDFLHRIEAGKRYKLKCSLGNAAKSIFLLQYGFKPANIDSNKAELMISTTECKVAHYRQGDGQKLNFAGVKSSLENKEFLISFDPQAGSFNLAKVQQSYINLRQKQDTDSENVKTVVQVPNTRDRVAQRLKKLTRKTSAKAAKPAPSTEQGIEDGDSLKLTISSSDINDQKDGGALEVAKSSLLDQIVNEKETSIRE